MHYARQNMRKRGPMESRKMQDHARQAERELHVLKKRGAALRELLSAVQENVETGDIPGSIEGSLYAATNQTNRQIGSLERWEMND